MEATSAPPILLPGIDHLPCLQEIRSVKDKPFYCQSSVGTIPFQVLCHIRTRRFRPFCPEHPPGFLSASSRATFLASAPTADHQKYRTRDAQHIRAAQAICLSKVAPLSSAAGDAKLVAT